MHEYIISLSASPPTKSRRIKYNMEHPLFKWGSRCSIVSSLYPIVVLSIYRFILAIALSVLQFEGSDYHFGVKLVTNQPVFVLTPKCDVLRREI